MVGSITTEQQKEFVVPDWSMPRPGVTQTPQGMKLEGDWYETCVLNDKSIGIYRINDGKPICVVSAGTDPQILIEALNMRSEHYMLRAYGRMHGELPTQRQLKSLEQQLATLQFEHRCLQNKYQDLHDLHIKTLETYEHLGLEQDTGLPSSWYGLYRTIGLRRTLGVLKTKGCKLWNSWFHRRS